MFVYSVRASALRFFGVLALSLAALVVLVALLPTDIPVSDVMEKTVSAGSKAAGTKISSVTLDTDAERTAFLAGFGWQVSQTPVEAVEVTVPARFDTVYQGYNEIQRGQGLDLLKYRGKKVMRYTYTVENYPDGDGTVYASLLLYKNKLIGGDICSADAAGFLHGFEKP